MRMALRDLVGASEFFCHCRDAWVSRGAGRAHTAGEVLALPFTQRLLIDLGASNNLVLRPSKSEAVVIFRLLWAACSRPLRLACSTCQRGNAFSYSDEPSKCARKVFRLLATRGLIGTEREHNVSDVAMGSKSKSYPSEHPNPH